MFFEGSQGMREIEKLMPVKRNRVSFVGEKNSTRHVKEKEKRPGRLQTS